MKFITLLFLTLSLLFHPLFAQKKPLPVDKWQYVQVDANRAKWGDFDQPDWLRYFGLAMMDINRDGYKDIVAGRYFYLNPGGNMTAPWPRTDLGLNVDGCLMLDVDGDEFADVIAMAYPDVYWLEADNWDGSSWAARKIGQVPRTDHVNGQGFQHANLTKSKKGEILLSAEGGLYAATIPDNPRQMANWSFKKIADSNSDEGIGLGDIDGDGDLDVVLGDAPKKGDTPSQVFWFENPGTLAAEWKRHAVGQGINAVDRVEVADFDGDGRADIAVSEELYPGLEPVANVFTFTNPGNAKTGSWTRQTVYTGFSVNNLDAADLDNDGDVDLVTAEHKGKTFPTMVFENTGKGKFTKRVINTGHESHLGTQLTDLDGDGDLDMVSAAWDNHKFLHVWRNDAIQNDYAFKLLSTKTGELPLPWTGAQQQTDALVGDFDKNGITDFIVTNRTTAPSVVMYRAGKANTNTWDRYIIDRDSLTVGTGGVVRDVDGDGDLDIILLADYQGPFIWWWENPSPNLDPNTPWKRRTIKKTNGWNHHDAMVADVDGDGKDEFVFWNQGAKMLAVAELPDNPKAVDEWPYKPIYEYTKDGEMAPINDIVKYPGWRGGHEHEGLATADINGDGVLDIVGGGRWFNYDKKTGRYLENIVDASYTFSRAAAGQLVAGGRPEIVFSLGDGIGPLYMYEWKQTYNDWDKKWRDSGVWMRKMLVDKIYDGHSISILDFNNDGHPDIFIGEMKLDANSPARIMVLLGDGKGNFVKHLIAEGTEIHEGKPVDLNGDGKIDVLSKPYVWESPRVDVYLNTSKE